MRSYGQSTEGLTDDHIRRKLTNVNCEFLNRPRMALSLLADTYLSNKEGITELATMVRHITKFLSKMEKIEDDLMVLSNRDAASGDDHAAVKNVIKAITNQNQLLVEFCKKAGHVSAGLYTTTAWLRSTNYLLNNLDIMKEKMHPDAQLPNFRANVNIDALIVDICSGVENLSLVKKVDNVNLDNLASSSDEERPAPKSVKRKLQLDDDDPEDEEQQPTTSKKKKKKPVTYRSS